MAYTQAPQLTEDEIESLLREANTARLCSLNPNGTIHAATINYSYENGRIKFATPEASRKAQNLRRSGNVTVLIDLVGDELSDNRGVLIYGSADVRTGTLSDMLSISEGWMGGDNVETQTKRLFELSKWVIVSVNVERTASWDYAKDEEFAAIFGK